MFESSLFRDIGADSPCQTFLGQKLDKLYENGKKKIVKTKVCIIFFLQEKKVKQGDQINKISVKYSGTQKSIV